MHFDLHVKWIEVKQRMGIRGSVQNTHTHNAL